MLKRKLSVLLAAAMALSLAACTTGEGEQPKDDRPDAFDEENIVLSFSAMSDIHQQKGQTKVSDMLVNALDYAEELNGKPLDLALFAGDLTERTWQETGKSEDYTKDYNADIEVLKATLERGLDLEKTGVFYALGNHDTDPSRLGTDVMGDIAGLFYRQLGEEFFRIDAEDSLPELGLRHAVVNGYHFLSLNPESWWNLTGYSDAALEWLDTQMKKITEEDPDRFVFVTAHPPMYCTVFYSTRSDWADRDVEHVLEKYPQAVYFSGHIHNVLQDETQYGQNGAFTVFDCGGVKYTGMMNELNANGKQFDNDIGSRIDDFSQGLLVQVDRYGNLRVTRCDYYKRSPIKTPCDIPHPKADNSHLYVYDYETREMENTAPVFGEEATIDAVMKGETLTFRWDAAKDDDMVRFYRLTLYAVADGKKTKKETWNIATFTYRYDQVSEMPEEYTFERVLDLPAGTYVVECAAADVWTAIGDPISAEFTL